MANLRMGNEKYKYEKTVINEVIEDKKKGNYALGYINDNGGFVPKYVGRSDIDLKERLISHIDNKDEPDYVAFMFSYAKTVKEAYEKECCNYHDFIKQLNNKYHPDNPDNKQYKCPVCGQ